MFLGKYFLVLQVVFGLFLFSGVANAATTIKTAPTNGLVGYWNFNEGTSTRATDATQYKNNGTLTNGPTWTNGRVGKALLLDGVDDFMSAASSDSLNNLPAVSVSAWVKVQNLSSSMHVVSRGSGTSDVIGGWYLRILNTGAIYFRVGYDFSTSDMSKISSTGIITPGKWVHILATWDGTSASANAHIYLNGVETSYSGNADGGSTRDADAVPMRIGRSGSLTNAFLGSIDEVRIYNRVLTPTEIQRVYQAGAVTLNTPLVKPANLQSGLVGYWSFNEPDFTDKVYDRSGQGNDGYVVNSATTTVKKAGKIGQGINLDGTDDFVQVAPNLPNLPQKTVTAWIRPRTISTNDTIFYRGTGGWGFDVNSGPLRLYQSFDTTGQWTTNSKLAMKQWQFVAVTYDNASTGNAPIFYVNGIATSSYQVTAPTGVAVDDSGKPTKIGSATSGYFDGSLDEVRIYNRILSATEIKQLYNNEAGSTIGFICGKSTVKDADNNTYDTLKIGSQCWMKQSLRVGTRISGATNQTNNAVIEKHCYSNSDANCTSNNPNYPDGGLYQWNEAMQYVTTPGARGICPAGWHIPTHDEFTTMERAVCTTGSCATDFPYDTSTTGYRGTTEGTKLKPNGTSGFEGNLAGYSGSGSFNGRGTNGFFWSSSESGGVAWYRNFSSGSAQVLRDPYDESVGLSVRCLKN